MHTEAIARRRFTQRNHLHRNLCREKQLHAAFFTHKRFYTQKPLHRAVFAQFCFTHKVSTQRNPHTKQFLHVTTQLLHTDASTHTETFTQSTIYTKYKDTQKEFLQRDFSVQKKNAKKPFPQSKLYIKQFSHAETFYTQAFLAQRGICTDLFLHVSKSLFYLSY